MKANGHEYLPKIFFYDICVDVVHHYINLYGFEWKIMYIPLDKFIFQILLLFIFKNNASKGAHLNLKRAERAWEAINKLPRSAFAAEVHGKNAYAPSIRVCTACTFAR